jgi:hypothetical protein
MKKVVKEIFANCLHIHELTKKDYKEMLTEILNKYLLNNMYSVSMTNDTQAITTFFKTVVFSKSKLEELGFISYNNEFIQILGLDSEAEKLNIICLIIILLHECSHLFVRQIDLSLFDVMN